MVEIFVNLGNRVARKREGKKGCNRVYAMGERKQHRKCVENWRDTKIYSVKVNINYCANVQYL